MFVMILIFVSTLSFVISTVPSLDPDDCRNKSPEKCKILKDIWNNIELVVVMLFSGEYVIRLLCAPNMLEFVYQPLNIVDVLAILPWYLELLLYQG